jgi:hypothetical protein
MLSGHEFPAHSHHLHFLYGLNEFVTLSPNAPKEKEDIGNEKRAKVGEPN